MADWRYAPPGGNVTSTVEIFEWTNGLVNNMFWPAAIFAVYVIILIKMLTNPNNTASKSFAAASFMCMILCVFARVLNFVTTGFMSLFIIFTAIGGIWMHMENQPSG